MNPLLAVSLSPAQSLGVPIATTLPLSVTVVAPLEAQVESLARGPQGDPGTAGAAGFMFEQPIASATWTIAHNLNKFPAVTVVDTAGDTIDPDITYIDRNTVILSYSAALGGSAYLI